MATARKKVIETLAAPAAPLPAPPVTINIENNNPPPPSPRTPRAPRRAPVEDEPRPDEEEDDDLPLAAFYDDDEVDPLTEFLERFTDGKTYQVALVRRPDTAEYDREWLKPCLDVQYFERFTFRPESFISDCQKKFRSGGKARVQLHDRKGYVPGGSITFFVTDPEPAQLAQWAEHSAAPVAAAAAPAPVAADPGRTLYNKFIEKQIEKLTDGPAMSPPQNPEAQLSERERMTLLVARDSNILPSIFDSLTQGIVAAVQSGSKTDAATPKTGQQTLVSDAMNVIASSRDLQLQVVDGVSRLLDKFLPKPPTSASNGGQASVMNPKQRQEVLLNYLMSACAENRKITFSDPEVVTYARSDPDEWQKLLGLLTQAPAKLIMERVASFSPMYRAVLNHKHAPAWVKHVKALAVEATKAG